MNLSSGYPIIDAGGYLNSNGFSAITKFDAGYKMVWSSRLPAFASDVEVDTSDNVYVVGSSNGGSAFPYVNPGNGAYIDPNPSSQTNGGSIFKFDKSTKLVWATTYYGGRNFFFNKIVYEKFRNLIHVWGVDNDITLDIPTKNDDCNGTYYYPSSAQNSSTDPILLSFTTGGKWLYGTFNHFPYAYYNPYIEMAVDRKGNLLFILGQVQEVPISDNPFPEKNPGNGAYFETESDNYQSEASFLMKLTSVPVHVIADTSLPKGCNCTGTIKITPTSCTTGNYKYIWSNGDSTAEILNVCPGAYTVKVVDQNTFNDTTITFKIPNPPNNINAATFTKSGDHCNKNDGSLIIKGNSGASMPYHYDLNNQPYTTNFAFNGLTSGKYTFNIKDKDGCIYTDSTVIDSISGPVNIFTSVSPAACNVANGKITIDSVKGGTLPFNYSIDNSIGISQNFFAKLETKKYLVKVVDGAGCDLSDSVEVKTTPGHDSFKTILDNNQCGQTIGSILVAAVAGGTMPYLYSLDGINFSVDSLFANLSSGKKIVYIKDANGCLYNDSLHLDFKSFPVVNLPSDTVLCNQSTLLLDASQSTSDATYIWQNGSTSPFVVVDKAGTYTVKVTKDGCIKEDTCIIGYKNSPMFNLGKDTTLCIGQTLLLSVNLPNATYWWNNGSTSSNYTVTSQGTYKVTVTNDCGISSDEITVSIGVCNIEMPTAFTPNNDYLNDEFRVKYPQSVKSILMKIFNRSGQLIFSSKDPRKGWDGSINGIPQETGNYIWTINYETIDGVKGNLKGNVLLIR